MYVKSDSFEKITLLNILQRTQKHFRTIVQFVIEDFNGKSQCEPISKMNMSAKMISSKPVLCAIIERAPWNRYEFTFSIGMASIWTIPVQMHHHHFYSHWMQQMLAAICHQLHWQRLRPLLLPVLPIILPSHWPPITIATALRLTVTAAIHCRWDTSTSYIFHAYVCTIQCIFRISCARRTHYDRLKMELHRCTFWLHTLKFPWQIMTISK